MVGNVREPGICGATLMQHSFPLSLSPPHITRASVCGALSVSLHIKFKTSSSESPSLACHATLIKV